MSRGPYRRHTPQFKLQLCTDIRSGTVGRRESQKKYGLSANLIQLWLTQYDRGELNREEVEAWAAAEYEAKIAALELKKTPRLHLVSSNESSSIVSGPKAAPSEGGAK